MKINFILILLLNIFFNNKLFSQFDNKSFSEYIINSTIRLESYSDSTINGDIHRSELIGTGFFYTFDIDSFKVPVIVTNYHVIRGRESIIINFTENINGSPEYGKIITEIIPNSKNLWIKHPNVDLAVLPIYPIIEKIKKVKNKIPYFVSYTENELPTKQLLEELTGIEEILMIGYPNGLWDPINNLPIVRKGITATPIYIDYMGEKQFLIDIPDYSGSSGSPIVLYNQNYYFDKNGNMIIGKRFSLLGINTQVFTQKIQLNDEGERNDNLDIVSYAKIPIDLGIIIKSEELLEFKSLLKTIIYSKMK